MGILEKLKNTGQKEAQINRLCVQKIRFRQFIENAKKILDYFDDGREKALEEYIFDRHYVVTLIDRVVETLGMMVFDACVLVPERGKEFYHVYDRQVLTAKRLLGEKPNDEKPGSEKKPQPETRAFETPKSPRAPGSTEPEYQLLFKALEWFNGQEYAGEEVFDSTVMESMEQLFFKVCLNLKTIGITVDQTSFKQGQLADNLELLEMMGGV